jgi:excisionase family DNA binding protein
MRQRKAVSTLGRAPIVSAPPSTPTAPTPPSAEPIPRELLTPRELASRLKIDPATVYRMTRSGELPYIPLKKRVRYDFGAVIAKLRSRAGDNE